PLPWTAAGRLLRGVGPPGAREPRAGVPPGPGDPRRPGCGARRPCGSDPPPAAGGGARPAPRHHRPPASLSLRESLARPRTPEEGEETGRLRNPLRDALGELDFDAAWDAGRAMTYEQAVAYALQRDAVGPRG